MKKIAIIFITLTLLLVGSTINNSYAASGDYYSDLNDYTSLDINENNAKYVADLAKQYILFNEDLYNNQNIDITNNFFDYSYIITDIKHFTIYFTYDISLIYSYPDTGAVSMKKGSFAIAITSYDNFSNLHVLNNTTYFHCYSRITQNTSYSTLDIFTSFDLYNLDNELTLAKNFNYINTIEETVEEPTFYYDIQDSDLGYKIAITPLNIECPYTFKCYFDDNYDNFYTLQDNSVVITTSNFIVNKNVKKLLFVCEHPTGALSLDVEIPKLNFGSSGTSSGSGGSNSNLNNIDKPFVTLKSIYNIEHWVTTVTTHNMQSDYKLYFSYDGGVTLNDMGFAYGINEYQVTTMKDEATKIMFLIESPEDGIIYTMEHKLLETSYDGSYSGLFGNIDSNVDIDNFEVEDGISAIKSFFNSVLEVFKMLAEFISFLPAWIVIPLNTFLTIIIILAIIEFIRG